MEVIIRDSDLDKTFVIAKMKATQLDSFISLAVRVLVKDGVKFPDGLLGSDIRQTIYNVVQNGNQEEGASALSTNKLMENIVPILRSAYSNLEESDRILLLDKLISTTTYKNGVVLIPLTYYSIDSYITSVATIYKLAWEVIKTNFTLLQNASS